MPTKLLAGLLILIFMPAAFVQAQTPNKTFISEDGSFTFQYPDGWTVDTVNAEMGPDHTSFVVNNRPLDGRYDSPDELMIQITFPQKRAAFAVINGGSTPAEILKASLKVSAFSMLAATPLPGSATPQPTDQPVIEYTVNGLPAARVTIQYMVMGMDDSVMMAVLDVGKDYLVLATISSLRGGIATIKKYEQAVIAIIETIRYTPKVVSSGNPELPQVYSGPVGVWQAGTITFSYPANWVVYTFATQIIQNVSEPVAQNAPTTGQMIAMIQGPSETRSAVDPKELGDSCNSRKSQWTARQIAQKMLTFSPGQIQQFKDRGITISKPVAVTINGKEIVYYYQFQGEIENLIILTDLGDSNVPTLSAVTRRGEMKNFEKQLLAIAGTFEYTPKPCYSTETPESH